MKFIVFRVGNYFAETNICISTRELSVVSWFSFYCKHHVCWRRCCSMVTVIFSSSFNASKQLAPLKNPGIAIHRDYRAAVVEGFAGRRIGSSVEFHRRTRWFLNRWFSAGVTRWREKFLPWTRQRPVLILFVSKQPILSLSLSLCSGKLRFFYFNF